MSTLEQQAADIQKTLAEIKKLVAETKVAEQTSRKLFMETIMYPFVAGAACAGAMLAVLKYFS